MATDATTIVLAIIAAANSFSFIPFVVSCYGRRFLAAAFVFFVSESVKSNTYLSKIQRNLSDTATKKFESENFLL